MLAVAPGTDAAGECLASGVEGSELLEAVGGEGLELQKPTRVDQHAGVEVSTEAGGAQSNTQRRGGGGNEG